MKLIVDANILFAALIKKGLTAKLLINDKLQLFAPEFLFEEFEKYRELILKKTHRSDNEFNQFLEILKERIIIIPKEDIIPYMKKAEKISPDPRDTIYLALAFLIKSNIWSNDRKLKEGQKEIVVLTKDELLKKQI